MDINYIPKQVFVWPYYINPTYFSKRLRNVVKLYRARIINAL